VFGNNTARQEAKRYTTQKRNYPEYFYGIHQNKKLKKTSKFTGRQSFKLLLVASANLEVSTLPSLPSRKYLKLLASQKARYSFHCITTAWTDTVQKSLFTGKPLNQVLRKHQD